jgi:hypothetical protein
MRGRRKVERCSERREERGLELLAVNETKALAEQEVEEEGQSRREEAVIEAQVSVSVLRGSLVS